MGVAGYPGGGPKAAIHSGLESELTSHPCVALSSYQAPPLLRRLPIPPNKNPPLWKSTAINPGGAKPLKELPPEMRAFRPDSAGDSRRYEKQIAVSPTHVCTFKCLPRKEMFRMLHTHTADAPRISIGTKG